LAPEASIGHSLSNKDPRTFRFAFVNLNGLSLTRIALADFTATAKEIEADWLGVAETHLDLSKTHVQEAVKSSIQSPNGFIYANCTFSATDVDFHSDQI
jgi:hypothetical protein